MAKISVKDTQVSVIKVHNEDYISLTDMLKAKEGEFFNPGFNSVEFDIIKSLAGLNNFRLSAKEWGGFPREFMLLVDL